MNKPSSTRNPSPDSVRAELTIRFVRQPPSEEVVYFARRCARKCAIAGPLTIVLEASAGSDGPAGIESGSGSTDAIFEVRLEQEGRVVVSERDPEILLAVRNAFDRLAINYVELPPPHLILPPNSSEAGPKFWS